MIKLKKVLLLLLLTVMAGCSSQVTRPEKAEATRPVIKALQDYTVELSPDAELKVADDVEFDINALKTTLDQKLNAKNLIASDGDYRLKVVVNGVRIRSTASAVMLGFMAGNDYLRGSATVLSTSGKPVYTFEVSVSYALGGFGGGQESTRMNWLYEKFSEHIANELSIKRGETDPKGSNVNVENNELTETDNPYGYGKPGTGDPFLLHTKQFDKKPKIPPNQCPDISGIYYDRVSDRDTDDIDKIYM